MVNFQDGTSDKVASNGNKCSKVHSLTMYENSLMTISDTGDHSMKCSILSHGNALHI